MNYDAYFDRLGAALAQEQLGDSRRPIACISRATLDSESHWTPLGLEADSIVCAIKCLQAYLWGTILRMLS